VNSETERFENKNETYVTVRGLGWKSRVAVFLFVFFTVFGCGMLLRFELRTSYFQAKYLTRLAKQATFRLEPGPSPLIRFPRTGPYDLRYGYALLPSFIERLKELKFRVSAQARISTQHAKFVDAGIFPIFHEKSQAGLKVTDRRAEPLLIYRTPEVVFKKFEDIPKIVLDTLLFIEDRNLLDESRPHHNPAIDWERLGKAVWELVVSKVGYDRNVPGGSTLATQTEKFRHSPEGITGKPLEKLRQMGSASLRAYLDGEENIAARRRIVLDYINSVPLAAVPGYGEVHGLGDGLSAYYGRDINEISRLLRAEFTEQDPVNLARQAVAFWQVLSLFLAHRRPSDYLGNSPQTLVDQIAVYLPLLHRMGIIPRALYETASNANSRIRHTLPHAAPVSFTERKGLNLVRTHLLTALGLNSLYDLDRLDLSVTSTLDARAQREVTKILSGLRDAEYARSAGLEGFRMLDRTGDASKVIYSFTLWERTEKANMLRVQTDNLDQPLDINQGAKLDLGSTAKLRTLITYLEIVEKIHKQYAAVSPKQLAQAAKTTADPITVWGLTYLQGAKNKALEPMLRAAMERKYSASPGEAFFTAGGLHTFQNFKPEDNGRIVTVREAIRHSINLPFIRLMRDIVRYYSMATIGSTARALKEMKDLERQDYLRRFADKEGQVFLGRFYAKYAGRSSEEIVQILLEGVRNSPRRFAAVFWAINPDAPSEQFAGFMRRSFADREFSEDELSKLHAIYHKKDYALRDRAYLARVHPLEIWVAGFLLKKPQASLGEAIRASANVRQEVYEWLFKTRFREAQNKRIRMMLDAEAFIEIHHQWQKLGYPLRSLVPSYATALGTSADRPDALAELMGIIINGGKRKPMVRLHHLEFAAETPYHTVMEKDPPESEQVLNPEIAGLVRDVLVDIVENGTAVRLRGGFKADGRQFKVGGKTGTGDHRYKVFGKGGWLKESRVVNRTATFMFIIDDRFFGTLTAFVRGPDAAKFGFTSALPVQLVKILGPALLPLLQESGEGSSQEDESLK